MVKSTVCYHARRLGVLGDERWREQVTSLAGNEGRRLDPLLIGPPMSPGGASGRRSSCVRAWSSASGWALAVFLEWFLRDAYGVKVLASAAFTQGLVSRGVISLGMG
jgi:hypothetical protein